MRERKHALSNSRNEREEFGCGLFKNKDFGCLNGTLKPCFFIVVLSQSEKVLCKGEYSRRNCSQNYHEWA